MGENLEVVWAEFSTLSQAVLLITPKLHSLLMAASKAENSALVLSCLLKFVHGLLSSFSAFGQDGHKFFNVIIFN